MLARPILFLSSYAPLFLILAIRFESTVLSLVCGGLAAVGIIGLTALMAVSKRGSIERWRVVGPVPSAGPEASAYLAGYLLPFVAVADPQLRELIAYGMFFVVAYFVNSKTGLVQVNPVIYMMPKRSVHFISVVPSGSAPRGDDQEKPQNVLVISKGKVVTGQDICLRRFSNQDAYVME